MFNEFKSWFDLAEIGQSRSSITNPLQWTMVILIVAVLSTKLAGLSLWVTICLMVSLLAVILLFLGSFIYFMRTNPDVLRSEQFHLKKMAIEQGLLGDSIQGLTNVDLVEPGTHLAVTHKGPIQESLE